MSEELTRSGFVSIIGRPNSGKSTLVNRVVGDKVSIVTDKPQTTRSIIRGIVTRPEGQIVFLDTPGVHKPIHRMNERMMESVRAAMSEVDLLALLVDSATPFGRGDAFTLDLIKPLGIPKFLLLNKIDKIAKRDLLPQIEQYTKLAQFDETIPISALTGEGVEIFVQEVMKRLPTGPYFYPEDQLSDQQERVIAAELIREKLIQLTQEELPYSTAVIIEKFEEGERLHRIFANIFVERDNHKAMIIGKAGRLLKEVGISARQDLERMFGRQVYLELHVKVRKGWRDDDESLRQLGFK